MRRSRIVGAAIGVVLVAGACATSTGTTASSRFGAGPSSRAARNLDPTSRDSIFAQAIADREGPRVSISAEYGTAAASRRLRAYFHVDDDAYVVVGHLDADGVLRIAFPNEPGDDGFVRGQQSYHTAEFFAGFSDQYRYRARSGGLFRTTQASYDSYDGGLGYVFIIASWRPMHFEQFATNGAWDTFEVADADYMRDPRPAIYELASLLAGENREAYTVKFARYVDTRSLNGGYGNYTSALGYGYCAGYEPLGFGFSPFENRYNFNPAYGYRSSFYYRGSRYFYDAAQDCYRSVPAYSGLQFGLAFGSPINTPPSRPRSFNPNGPRNPLSPRVPPGHVMPLNSGGQSAGTITSGEQTIPATSPHYRQRGLITTDEPSTGPVRRQPRVETRPIDEGSRPSIQEMMNRHSENAHEGSGWSRAQTASDAGTTRQGPSASPSPQSHSAPAAPAARSEPRSQPAPHMEAPTRTSPPPERAAPRSEPAPRSQPASSGSKPPEKTPRT